MSVSQRTAQNVRVRLLKKSDTDGLRRRLSPRLPAAEPLPDRLPLCNDHTAAGLEKRRGFLKQLGIIVDCLAGEAGRPAPETLSNNIENLVGFAQVPVAVIGPLRINGIEAHGDFFVPMATSEGALVASYHRGAYVISHAGGAAAMCLTESISRAPCFVFKSTFDACRFLEFAMQESATFQERISRTSGHCTFMELRSALAGRNLFLGFDYQTGDAAGQNMVTFATDALCRYLVEKAPVKPVQWYVEGNMSGDKKATMLSFLSARGKKVIAEVVIPAALLKKIIHVTPLQMIQYGHAAMLGGTQSGSIGVQGHYANALAAMFIACGQDAACVSEASTGLTDMDVTEGGDLYASVTLPNVIVGTVGGGTHLPTAHECLAILGCVGEGTARKFAEICTATILAGEISIMGALAAGEFASAHARYARQAKQAKG
ncbi:MAG TPA: hydroxymethylglutaryl-CoA reductase [Verrucomicrobiae bacterium]|nr:hydroxymethylglutaryl-CoA reductase [Verrucomicrobiae bacterium]